MESIDLTGFLDDFRTEALEHVRVLDAQLLILERDPSNLQTVRTMFLAAHSIKGGAGMLDLGRVRLLAHAIEDALAEVREERIRLNRTLADILFQAVDQLRVLVERSRPAEPDSDPATARLIEQLRGQLGRSSEPERVVNGEPHPPAQPPRALLVEDSATVRRLVSGQLSLAGFEVDPVRRGQEALALVATHRYNIVIASMITDDIAGPDLVAAIRALTVGQSLPILLMSSDDNPARQQEARQAGADAMIRKGSFREHELVNAVLALVAKRAMLGQSKTE